MEWARFNSLNHLVRATELTVHICSLQAHMLSSPSYAIKECGVMMPHLACLFLQNWNHRENSQTDYGSTETDFGLQDSCDVTKPVLSQALRVTFYTVCYKRRPSATCKQTNMQKATLKPWQKNGHLVKVVLLDLWAQSVTALRVICSNGFLITNLTTMVKMTFDIISHTDRTLWVTA